jgi:hypothetical protein
MPKLSELADAINIMQEISAFPRHLASHKGETRIHPGKWIENAGK